MEITDLFVLRDYLLVFIKYLALRDLPVFKHLECLMSVLLFISALLEHGVGKGTLLVLVSTSLVVLYER